MSAIDAALATLEASVGTEIGVSNWITVDQAMIDAFAVVTHDDQWIHLDADRAARETPFGGTVAHGFLTLSLASRFAYDCFEMLPGQSMGINYGCNHLRFLSPVTADSRLRGRFVLKANDKRRAHEMMQTLDLTIEIEGSEKPALVAEWLRLAIFE